MDRVIDTHVHLWNFKRRDFPWITADEAVLARNFGLSDYFHESVENENRQAILVQARQVEDENEFLCRQANTTERVVGVVGWLDLQKENVEERLEQLKNNAVLRKIVGIRHLVQDELDVRFMLRPAFIHGLLMLREFGLSYDVLLRSTQLGQFNALLQVIPEAKSPNFVLDHMGKPRIGGGRESFVQWRHDISKMARNPFVFCKISGLLTEMEMHAKPTDVYPYIEEACQLFGVDRMLLGSDWPVCTRKGSLEQSLFAAEFLKPQLTVEDWKKITNLNALKAYGLPK
jgi:L-fuconolactonase